MFINIYIHFYKNGNSFKIKKKNVTQKNLCVLILINFILCRSGTKKKILF